MQIRRPSPAVIIAGLALFCSLGGTAIAAHHYLITSTKQISPAVLRNLKGRAGTNGAAGPKGEPGPAGPTGAAGPQGPLVTTLPSGKTLVGSYFITFEATAGGDEGGTQISFPFPLSSDPTPHYVSAGAKAPSGCAGGTAKTPKAEPGNLCVYEAGGLNMESGKSGVCSVDEVGLCPSASTEGAAVYTFSQASGRSQAVGTWAVTAP